MGKLPPMFSIFKFSQIFLKYICCPSPSLMEKCSKKFLVFYLWKLNFENHVLVFDGQVLTSKLIWVMDCEFSSVIFRKRCALTFQSKLRTFSCQTPAKWKRPVISLLICCKQTNKVYQTVLCIHLALQMNDLKKT